MLSLNSVLLCRLRLNHAVVCRGHIARAVSILHDMALADQVRENVGGCAIVLDTFGQLVALRLDPVVLGKFLLDVQLFLLFDEPLGIDLLLGATSLRADLEHVGSVTANDLNGRVRQDRFDLRLTDVELRKAAASPGSIWISMLRSSLSYWLRLMMAVRTNARKGSLTIVAPTLTMKSRGSFKISLRSAGM